MATLQEELIRTGFAKKEDYEEELQLQNIPPELRPAMRRLRQLEHKAELAPAEVRTQLSVNFLLLAFASMEGKKKTLENICDILERL